MAHDAANNRRLRITEHEGLILSVISRRQPVTGYQLFKVHGQSPLSSVNTSKGQLYPAIRRLKDRRLLRARKAKTGARDAEVLFLTKDGLAALKAWVRTIDDSHIVLDDPIAARVQMLESLSREERLEWIANAKALVKARMTIVEEYDEASSSKYRAFARKGALDVLRVKMEWLDDLLFHVAASS